MFSLVLLKIILIPNGIGITCASFCAVSNLNTGLKGVPFG